MRTTLTGIAPKRTAVFSYGAVLVPLVLSAAGAVGADTSFSYTVLDSELLRNGHKPKVIGDFDNSGNGAVGVEGGPGEGFRLYRYPDWRPIQITSYGHANGDEDAQVADVNGDGALDIVIGGLGNVTYWLENPLKQGKDPYASTWAVHEIDVSRPSHDIVVGYVNGDGKLAIATECGIYLQDNSAFGWTVTSPSQIARADPSIQGTALVNLFNDGALDLVAPNSDATALVWFENPKHRGGNPYTDVWTPHVIDASPGFAGHMTIATADFNRDGRMDIALTPMYQDGTLAWYEAPADPYKGTWIRHPIGPASYVHQGTLQVRDFDGDGLPDIAFAEQEQSAAKRVGIFYNGGGGASWRLQVLANTGGHNLKAGMIARDSLPGLVNANHGFMGAPNPFEMWRSLPPSLSNAPATAASSGPTSDDFNGTSLNSPWTSTTLTGDVTFQVNGGELAISVPGGHSHAPWTSGNLSGFVTQPAVDGDVTVEAKYDSAFTAQYQMHGIVVQQDDATYLRLETYFDGATTHLFAAALKTNQPTVLGDMIVPQNRGSAWLRLTRKSDAWTLAWSGDGASFDNALQFTYPMKMARIGVFAGNDGGDASPAFTGLIDYLHVNPGGLSDEFNGTVLGAVWTTEDPIGDSILQEGSGRLTISIPAGKAHDGWTTGNFFPRATEGIANRDLTLEAKYDSAFSGRFQTNGIVAQQDASHYLRLETYYDGSSLRLFAAGLNLNVPSVLGDLPIGPPAASTWLRCTRVGDSWALDWSADGVTFNSGLRFTYPITLSRVGVYAGNECDNGIPPAFSAAIDYFHVKVQ